MVVWRVGSLWWAKWARLCSKFGNHHVVLGTWVPVNDMNEVMMIPEKPAKLKKSHSSSMVMVVGMILVVLAAVALIAPRMGGEESVISSGYSDIGRRLSMAPSFELEPLEGNRVVSLEALKGKPVWLTFWATWCPPCKVEMPDLNDVVAEGGGDRFEYVAVATGEPRDTVQGFIDKTGYVLPVGLDSTSKVAIDFEVYTLPKHIFINADGEIVNVHSGILRRAQIEELVRDLW